jgi:hypothetical protein
LLVKLKCNRDHIFGLNWVLANIVKIFKIHYRVIRLFCKIHSYIKKKNLPWWFFNWMWCTTGLTSCSKNQWMKNRQPFLTQRSPLLFYTTKWCWRHLGVKNSFLVNPTKKHSWATIRITLFNSDFKRNLTKLFFSIVLITARSHCT